MQRWKEEDGGFPGLYGRCKNIRDQPGSVGSREGAGECRIEESDFDLWRAVARWKRGNSVEGL